MPGADGQPGLEPLQPVGPSQPHNHRTGWSDRHNTHQGHITGLKSHQSNIEDVWRAGARGGGWVISLNSTVNVLY